MTDEGARRGRKRYATPAGKSIHIEELAGLLPREADGRQLVVSLGAAGLEHVVAYWYERAVPDELWAVTDPALVRANFDGPAGQRRAILETYSWALVREPRLQVETLEVTAGPHTSARFDLDYPRLAVSIQRGDGMWLIGSFAREILIRARGR